MKLQELIIEGYKCFKSSTTIPFHDLTVLIGENDCGKSTILKALDLLLNRSNPGPDDFFNLNGFEFNKFTLIGIFTADLTAVPDAIKPYVIDNRFQLKKVYDKAQSFKTFSKKVKLDDENLEKFNSLSVADTKALLIQYGLSTFSNQDERRVELKSYIEREWENLPKTIGDVEINFNEVSQAIPYFQYYGSHEYGNPQQLVKKTLDNIVRNQFYNENGELKLKSVKGIEEKLLTKLNSSIEQSLLIKIKKYNPRVQTVQGRINMDFSQGLSFHGLELDEGQGYKLIDQKGEGSKKRLFLSILEWDKEVQTNTSHNRPIIRAYDEPDSNLHYEAQRKMFYAISEVASNPKANTQSIIATHSIAMIDRAPSSCINHIIQDSGESSVNYLATDGDEDVRKFLDQISVVGGIKNSSIFYEKCFLIVEGDSEEACMGKIYKKLYNRTLSEDGIVLINLQTNGAWYNFLKLLNSNKKHSTVILLDTDTQNSDCGAKVTPEKLTEIGFDAAFLRDNVFFVGIQEFEDLYPDHRIREAFNILYPRPTKRKWSLKDIQQLRATHLKISKGFAEETKKFIAHHKRRYKKPDFATEITDLITENEWKAIPILQTLFSKVHQIIN